MRRIAMLALGVAVGIVVSRGGISVARGNGIGLDPPSVTVRGVKYFSPEQVARELDQAMWFQAVYGAATGWDDPEVTLQHITVAGYRRAGFRDVAVRTRLDSASKAIELEVEEGRQYLAGNVHVEGAGQIATEQLIARLAERVEPKDSRISGFIFQGGKFQPVWTTEKGEKAELKTPHWSPGRPIAFGASEGLLLEGHLAEVFGDLGYPQARADLDVRSAEDGVLDLVVHVVEEGPPLTADSIEILGVERNTRDDVLTFLEIQPGDPIDRTTRIDLTRRLWQSARFTSIDVAVERSSSESGTSLRITLQEYEKAPPLREELTEAENVMMQLHEWLARLPQGSTMLRFQTQKGEAGFKVFFGSGRAFALQLEGIRLFLTPDHVEYYSDFQKKKLQMEFETPRVELTTNITLSDDRSDSDSLFNFGYQWLVKSDHDPESPPGLNFGLYVPPVTCLAFLDGRATQHTIEGGVLSIRSPKEELRIETKTGRLLDLRFLGDAGNSTSSIEPVDLPLGDFVIREWPEVASYEDAMLRTRPVSSLTRLVIRDWHTLSQQSQKKLPILGKYPPELERVFLHLADQALLNTIDDFVMQAWSEARDDPSRPRFRKSDLPVYLKHAMPENQLSWLPMAARDLGRNLVPTDSWLSDMALSMLSSTAGSKRMENYYWRQVLMASSAGPVRDVIVASRLQQKEPEIAHQFALRGTALLDRNGFHRDRDLLLDESAYLGRFLVHAAESLRNADPEGLDALQMLVFRVPDPGLRVALIYLQYHQDQPTWQTLAEALDHAWDTHWRALVEARLMKIETATRPKGK